MGISTWSMHYTGMLAFRLPIPIEYDWPTAFLSYLASFCTSALGLFVVSRRKMGFVRAFTASIFMGGGVAAMHYTAMASMRLRAVCHYSPALVTISVVLAIVFSLMSLWLMFLFREEALGQYLRKVASAVLLGAAIAVMHYTGMTSASFIPCAEFPDLSHTLPISALGIPGIAVANLMIVVVVLLTSLADRLQKQKVLLDELFEQAPQAVALMGVDHRILRVNKEFSRVFGYSSQEALGRRISELIAGEEAREEEQKYADSVVQGQRVDAEGVRRRKDGSELYVSMVRVAVRLPKGQVAIYAIYRDVSARKAAEAALSRSEAQLRALAARLHQAREGEAIRIARELHDQLGRCLTTMKLDVGWIEHELSGGAAVESARALLLLEKAREVGQGLDETVHTVRRLCSELRPGVLDDLGLAAAIEWQAKDFQKRSGVACVVRLPKEDLRVSREQATSLFRIFQETLTNVARHAQAMKVWVHLGEEHGAIVLEVEDDGVGISATQLAERRSLGLLGMRERAAAFGGEVDIAGVPAKGTTVIVRMPVDGERL
jgi:PAS domain S-box-containing protein